VLDSSGSHRREIAERASRTSIIHDASHRSRSSARKPALAVPPRAVSDKRSFPSGLRRAEEAVALDMAGVGDAGRGALR